MNSAALARTAYRQSAVIAPSERTVEYRAFAQITGQLATAEQDESHEGFLKLCPAVQQNRRLWGILAADAAANGNGLPDALRGQIVSLADFTWKHSVKVLRKEADAQPLIDINTAIMRGLRGAEDEG